MQRYVSRRAEEAERELAARNREDRALNDELMASDAFRRFLDRLADRYGYLSVPGEVSDYQRGANDAVRHILNQCATNSASGSEWIRDYAARAAKKESEK